MVYVSLATNLEIALSKISKKDEDTFIFLSDLAKRVHSDSEKMYAIGKIRGRLDTLEDLDIINHANYQVLNDYFTNGVII